MPSYDVKKHHKALYAPSRREFAVVDVPPMTFLAVDGHGDPNTATAYRAAVEALYGASYAVRALAKARLGIAHVVAPLEGLWSAADMAAFHTREKSAWRWTMMIGQPEHVTTDLVEEAIAGKPLVRVERVAEGRCVQILHIGSYDDEGPTLARLHEEFLPANGLVPTGRHHEIYLSDARRTEPARLRTILRQPVSALG